MLWQVAVVHSSFVPYVVPEHAYTTIYLCADGQLYFSRLFLPWTMLLETSLHMSVGTRVRVSLEFIQKWCCWLINHVNIVLFKIILNCFPKWVCALLHQQRVRVPVDFFLFGHSYINSVGIIVL